MIKIVTKSDAGRQLSNARQEDGFTTVLLAKYRVDAGYYEMIEASVEDICQCLMQGVEYSAEELVGFELWSGLSLSGQREAHLCLKHMATQPGARLTDMACENCGNTRFQFVG